MSKFKCRRILSLLSAAAMVVTLLPSTVIAAEELTYGDFSYAIVKNNYLESEVHITEYNGNAANVVIPSEIDGMSVSTINDNCFKDNTAIESVTIPESVSTIRSYAFSGCTSLKEVNLSEGLKSIGSYAFSGSAIEELDLPSTARSIGIKAFYNCTSLEKAYLNYELTTIAARAFENCSSLSEITYPGCLQPVYNSHNEDNMYVFKGCKNLKKIVVPEGATEIIFSEFYGADYLEEIVLPDTIETIGSQAFTDCTNLKTLIIPEGVEYIYNAFYNTNIENLVIPDRAICEMDIFTDETLDYSVTTHPYSNQAAGLLYNGVDFYHSDATNFIATNKYFKRSTYELAQPLTYDEPVSVELNVNGYFDSDSDEIYDVYITYPDGYDVVEDSIMINGEPVEVVEIRDNYIQLSNYYGDYEEIFSECYFTVEAQFKRTSAPNVDYLAEFDSVAFLSTSREDSIIDFIYASEPVISLDVLSTDYSTAEAFGYYTPQTEVDIYVDGEYIDTVMTNKVGRYSLELELSDEKTVFEIEAVASDNVRKKATEIYDIENASLEEFIVSIGTSDGSSDKRYEYYDLLDNKKDIITIYPQLGNYQKTFTFEFNLDGNISGYSDISVVAKVAEGEIEQEAYWDSQKRRYVSDFIYYLDEIVPEEIMIRCTTINGDIECFYPVIQPSWIIDPSGYVYAGVTSDRLEGVKAKAYFVEYDGSGDFWSEEPSDNDAILWDAENYNQTNPIYSDGLGQYGWDVPQGWWKIKYTLDGYQTAWSDWLKVAPAQLQVNINMLSTATPEIVDFAFTENGAVVEFDMYMDTDSLENVVLKDRNGNPLEYTVSYPLSDTSYEGTVYSKTFTFVTDEVAYSADVPAEVTSYAGVAVTADSFENENAVMLGDLNENGEVDLRDVVLLYQLFSGCEVDVNPVAADVNCSGQPDIRDVVLLYQAFSGWEVTLGGNTQN